MALTSGLKDTNTSLKADKLLKRMATLGFYIQPWQTAKYKEYPSIGRFEGDQFDPEAWKSRVPGIRCIATHGKTISSGRLAGSWPSATT